MVWEKFYEESQISILRFFFPIWKVSKRRQADLDLPHIPMQNRIKKNWWALYEKKTKKTKKTVELFLIE